MHASNRETVYSAGSGDWTQARLITVSGSARPVPMSHRDKQGTSVQRNWTGTSVRFRCIYSVQFSSVSLYTHVYWWTDAGCCMTSGSWRSTRSVSSSSPVRSWTSFTHSPRSHRNSTTCAPATEYAAAAAQAFYSSLLSGVFRQRRAGQPALKICASFSSWNIEIYVGY